MPYRDDTELNQSAPLPQAELSETEKHWNQITVAFIAIGTTILTAILVLYRFQEPIPRGSTFNLVPEAVVLFATMTYIAAFVTSIRTLFLPQVPDTRLHLVNKRNTATTAISLFSLLPLMVAVLIFTAVITPITETGPDVPSPTQDEANGTKLVPTQSEKPTEPASQGQPPEPHNPPENGDSPTPAKEPLPQKTKSTQP